MTAVDSWLASWLDVPKTVRPPATRPTSSRRPQGLGQLITFAVDTDPDETYSAYIWVHARKGDTPAKIAKRRGHPEAWQKIVSLNHIRGRFTVLHAGRRIKLPGTLKQGDTFTVLPQDMLRPQITDGYATYSTVARPGQIGVNQFTGYNPLTLVCPVEFRAEKQNDGSGVEADIATLERMAGRGNFAGAASGAPAVVRVSVTDASGKVVPLISTSYQWSPQNPTAPTWRIGTIDWDSSPFSDSRGRRVLQKVTITLVQYTPIVLAERSAARRSKKRNSSSHDKKPVKH